MITVKFESESVLNALKRLQKASSDLEPALLEIGEVLTESTKQRFSDTQSPAGIPWAPNKASTLKRKGNKPRLTGETGVLGDTINAQLASNNTLEIGSPMQYAAMQQFGGTKAEFPNLWGDIPSRPFLGISNEDEKDILEIINDHLQLALI